MIKKLSAYIGKYKMQALLSPILVLFEVVLEVYIPMLMGKIVDVGIPSSDFGYILKMGGLMVLMAIGALVFGHHRIKHGADIVALQRIGLDPLQVAMDADDRNVERA